MKCVSRNNEFVCDLLNISVCMNFVHLLLDISVCKFEMCAQVILLFLNLYLTRLNKGLISFTKGSGQEGGELNNVVIQNNTIRIT